MVCYYNIYDRVNTAFSYDIVCAQDFSPRLTAIEDSFHLLRDAFGLPTSPSPTSDTTMVDTDMANTADVTVSDSELHSTSHNST